MSSPRSASVSFYSQLQRNDQRYVALDIPPVDEELSQASPAINDWGEIVYRRGIGIRNGAQRVRLS